MMILIELLTMIILTKKIKIALTSIKLVKAIK